MKIKEIFVRDFTPKVSDIDYVIEVTSTDQKKIFRDINEYVVTPEIHEFITKFIDTFLESRRGAVNKVCTWVSGFFGSGKSHFVEVVGHILKNSELIDTNGVKHQSTSFFFKKHGLPHLALLEKEFVNDVYFIHMLDHDYTKGWSITSIIYSAVLRNKGFSDVFWIAEIELSLRSKGIYEKFKETVKRRFGDEWTNLRSLQMDAASIIAQTQHEIDPITFPTIESANQGIENVKNSIDQSPSKIVDRLLKFAVELEKDKGRIILILDEVSIYVSKDIERLKELDVISEKVVSIGKGKVWLICTAQEKLNDVIDKANTQKVDFHWLSDRFQLKFQLTPSNIDLVVKKRLLEKRADPHIQNEIKKCFTAFQGSLLQATQIPDATHYDDLFVNFKMNDFVEYYPLLPYHIYLMQEIFGLLRAKGEISQKLTGNERAVLIVVCNLLIQQNPDDKDSLFYDAEIGKLVTFDVIFDIIEKELQSIDSKVQANVKGEISQLGDVDGLKVSSVAKALFLLQQVEVWLPTTLDNIAAILYPSLGFDRNVHIQRVKDCLDSLVKNNWIKLKDKKYYFLSTFERTFNQILKEQIPTEPEKTTLIKNILTDMFKKGSGTEKADKLNYKNTRVLPIKLTADRDAITTEGDLHAEFFSPYISCNDKNLEDEIKVRSIGSPNTLYWVAAKEEEFEDLIQYKINMEKTIRDFESKNVPKEEKSHILDVLSDAKRELDVLIHDKIPANLIQSFEKGKVVLKGTSDQLDGLKKFSDLYKEKMNGIADVVFPEFISLDKIKINDEADLKEILKWKGGSLNPVIFTYLKLFDTNSKELIITSQIPLKIISEIRASMKINEVLTGKDLIANLQAPPYGWDDKIVRFTIAALFTNSTITLEMGTNEITDPQAPESLNALKGIQSFNKIKIKLGEDISPAERNEISTAISDIFNVNGGQTIKELDDCLSKLYADNLDRIKQLNTITTQLKIPTSSLLKSLLGKIQEFLKLNSGNQRLLLFLKQNKETTDPSLKQSYRAFREFDEFEKSGKLEDYKTIHAFIVQCKRIIEGFLDSSTQSLENSLKTLETEFDSPQFINRWGNISSNYQQVKAFYANKYHENHKSLIDAASQSIINIQSVLKDHGKDITVLSSSLKKEYKKLENYICTNGSKDENELEKAPFTCIVCTRTLQNIIDGIELIGTIEQKVIDALNKPGGGTPPGPGSKPGKKPTGDPYLEAISFLTEKNVQGILGLLRDYIDSDKIEEKFIQAFVIIKDFIPQRIVVKNNAVKNEVEDIINNSECRKVYITSLEDTTEAIPLPKGQGIVCWAYEVVPLKDEEILPVIRKFIPDFLIMETKEDRNKLFPSLKMDMVTLNGEFQDSSGDILAGK